MPLRVSASLTKRLDAVDRVARRSDLGQRYQLATILGPHILTEQDMSELTVWQRTVLSWPRVIAADDWEREAQATQQVLCDQTSDWLGPPPVVTGPDPADTSHLYKPNPATVQR